MPSLIKISFDSHIFSQEALLHACYELAELATFEIKTQNDELIVVATNISEHFQADDSLMKRLRTAAIDHQLREKITQQTQSIRETLIQAALHHAQGDC